jgi:hypothetical protein
MYALSREKPELRCVVCLTAFDFRAGEAPLVLRHVAYGYDFVHDDTCLAAASQWLFVEPGYDCGAFARDPERRRVVGVAPADGWMALLAYAPEPTVAGRQVRSEPLLCWALVEHQDGSTSLEGLVRDEEWLDQPGGAEFPEAVRGPHTLVGYASATGRPRHPDSRAA